MLLILDEIAIYLGSLMKHMNNVFIILCMIFCHVIADYNLQGWLASAKQKSYWEKNAPDEMYKHDYICALVMHSFSWTFMIMLPLMYVVGFKVDSFLLFLFVSNVLLHAITDDFKANKKFLIFGKIRVFTCTRLL